MYMNLWVNRVRVVGMRFIYDARLCNNRFFWNESKIIVSAQKYPFSLRLIHWTMAVLIIGLITLGVIMTRFLTDEPYTQSMFYWHKSFGVVALMLIMLRIGFRLALNKQVPPLSSTLPKLEQIAAAVGHKLLYLLMLLVPLSGYLTSSAYGGNNAGIFFFGLRLPDALPKNQFLCDTFALMHTVTGYALATVIVLHIAAVIKHRYFDHHERDIVRRMW